LCGIGPIQGWRLRGCCEVSADDIRVRGNPIRRAPGISLLIPRRRWAPSDERQHWVKSDHSARCFRVTSDAWPRTRHSRRVGSGYVITCCCFAAAPGTARFQVSGVADTRQTLVPPLRQIIFVIGDKLIHRTIRMRSFPFGVQMMDVQPARAPAKNTEECMVGHMSSDTTQRRTSETAFCIGGLSRQQTNHSSG
jgi:hypothetical protein